MTTKQQVNRLYRPLLERHADLAIVNATMAITIIVKPVHHLIRGFYVVRSAYADFPDYFWFVGDTFYTCGPIYGICATNFILPDIKTMYWSHPRNHEAFHQFVENELLPLLRSVDTIDRMLSFRHPMEERWKPVLTSPVVRIRLSSALGNLEDAADAARELRAEPREFKAWWGPRTYDENMQLAALIDDGDRAGIAALLHGWSDQYVAHNGLQPLFVRRPLPIETARPG